MSLFTAREPGVFEKSMRYLGWQFLAQAVIQVYDSNLTAEGVVSRVAADAAAPPPPKANADTWGLVARRRRYLVAQAVPRWCALTGLSDDWWPYNEDAVVRMYLRYRKRSEDELRVIRDEIERAL